MPVVTFPGHVELVGAGPGDPELLTCKALKALQRADIVVHDRLVSKEILALIPDAVPLVDVGKSPDHHPVPQEEINQMLVRLAQQYPKVVRLKGGDPYMFARGSEEEEVLREAGVQVTAIPGISAAQGVAAATGVPLTHRGLATGVRFVTGHCRKGHALDLDWAGLADPKTTLVFYMGRGHAGDISDALIAHGMSADVPAMLVADGTRPTQVNKVTTLAGLADTAGNMPKSSPVLMVIGHVVRFAFGSVEKSKPDFCPPALGQVGHG